MKKLLPFLFFCCSAICPFAQSPVQTLRGTVTDADNARPLLGAAAVLLGTDPLIGTTTNESGSYNFAKIPVGRYRMQVSHLGYEALTIAEVLVESGRETVLNMQLRERADSLQAVVVKAPGNRSSQSIGIHTLTVEEQFRFPATFFDPARLAMAHPGVAGNNDGTNVISVRGNSPNALQWRLEGVEIVNPNHTANAGTFGDRPTGAGGGVNILSAQLLGTSNFLTGAFPAEYGNALGGIMDMYLRPGNDQQHEFTVQVGFLGIEAAAEGPITVDGGRRTGDGTEPNRPPSPVRRPPSFLLNYRYSFTGLLTAMGADFGDEETAFQDVAFQVSLPSPKGQAAKAGKLAPSGFTLFGMGGKSSTLYRSPNDTATIDKERFNIDFHSKMGAVGLTHVLPIGKNSVLRTVAIASALEHDRTADFVASGQRWEDDHLRQQKLSFSSIFSHKINASHRWRAGVEAAHNDDGFHAFFKNNFVSFENGGDASGWLVQPFLDWHGNFGEKLEVVAGLHASIFTTLKKEILPEPRFSLSYDLGRGRLALAYGLHSQSLPTYLMASSYADKYTRAQRAQHLTLGYQIDFGKSLVFKAEAYGMGLFDVPVFEIGQTYVSTINFTDFSLTYLGSGQPNANVRLVDYGEGRNYGLDLSLQKYLTERQFFLLAGSLYRSEYEADPPSLMGKTQWHSTRFDGRHTLSLTNGGEFVKQKNGKTIIRGVSSRIAWLGGFRDTPIDEVASASAGYTVYDQQRAFTQKLNDYFRVDLRIYRKWNRAGRNSMLSLDIQNLGGRKNAQYHYFDTVQDRVLLKKQLGLIPILTWRGEF